MGIDWLTNVEADMNMRTQGKSKEGNKQTNNQLFSALISTNLRPIVKSIYQNTDQS